MQVQNCGQNKSFALAFMDNAGSTRLPLALAYQAQKAEQFQGVLKWSLNSR